MQAGCSQPQISAQLSSRPAHLGTTSLPAPVPCRGKLCKSAGDRDRPLLHLGSGGRRVPGHRGSEPTAPLGCPGPLLEEVFH